MKPKIEALTVEEKSALRDEFAKAALQGVLANPNLLGTDPRDCAAVVWGLATAMVENRLEGTDGYLPGSQERVLKAAGEEATRGGK